MKTLKMLGLLVCLFTSSAVSALSDPVTQTTVPCYYFGTYNWDYPGDGVPLVEGQVYFPSESCNSDDGPVKESPVIIFMHGKKMDNKDHTYLMRHLALNGFVVASIANGLYEGGSNEGRAKQAISYLNFLHRFWGHRSKLSNKVIFMGHSRGGEAAITAARLLYEQPDLAYTSYAVKSVVSMAPTDGGGGQGGIRETLTGNMTNSFLALYGSHDRDVIGVRLEDPLLASEKTVFATYDRAEHENSKEGVLTALPMSKAMIFIHGGNHTHFMDGPNICSLPAPDYPLSCASQRNIARGYIVAFLRWKVFLENDYRAYFEGTTIPPSLGSESSKIFCQFSDGKRRVLDNFGQNGIATNTAGGSVVAGAGISELKEGKLWELDPSSPHHTQGASISWVGNPNPSVRWNIPDNTIWGVGKRQDVSGFKYLSFRVAQVYKGAGNIENFPVNFYIRLHSSSGLYMDVPVGSYATIPYPAIFIGTNAYNANHGDYTKSGMQTVRVPLAAFRNANLKKVKAVEFFFSHPRHRRGTIHVDNLEFVN